MVYIFGSRPKNDSCIPPFEKKHEFRPFFLFSVVMFHLLLIPHQVHNQVLFRILVTKRRTVGLAPNRQLN